MLEPWAPAPASPAAALPRRAGALAHPPRRCPPATRTPSAVAERGLGDTVLGHLPRALRLHGLLVQVLEPREEARHGLEERVVADVSLHRVAEQVQRPERGVVRHELAQRLGRGDPVEAHVQERELEQAVQPLHVVDLVPGQVELPDRRAARQT
jgi:hypothetical protein